MLFPSIWGEGAVLSFSAANGECNPDCALWGTLFASKFGAQFLNKACFYIDMTHIDLITPMCVLSDIVTAKLISNGDEYTMSMIMTKQNTMLFYSSMYVNVHFSVDGDFTVTNEAEGVYLYSAADEYFAVACDKTTGTKYAVSYGKTREDALKSAKDAVKENINAQINKKIDFYQTINAPRNVIEDIEKLYYKCVSTVKAGIYGNTFSDRPPVILPYVNAYDGISVFKSLISAVCCKNIFAEYAKSTVLTVCDMILKSGALPFKQTCREEFIAPPVLVWAMWEVFGGDTKTLEKYYPKLRTYVKYITDNRDINKNNVFEWHSDNYNAAFSTECNMKNSPIYDDGVIQDSVDLTSFTANEARHLAKIAKTLQMRSEAAYWEVMFDRIKRAANSVLYNSDDGFYYDKTIVSSHFKNIKTVAGFMPLFGGICTPQSAAAICDKLKNPAEFNTRMPIPSVSRKEQTKCADMYRGPVWLEYNYLTALGLKEYGFNEKADEIIKKSILLVKNEFEKHGVIYECYSSDSAIPTQNMPRYGVTSPFYTAKNNLCCARDYIPAAAIIASYILDLK